jgi:uncharacterized protein (DUF983 family)
MRIHTHKIHEISHFDTGPRPLFHSLARGFLGRCPNCGEGRLFRGYLKPVPACAACSEDFTHQRADDFPPYATIVIVGHLVLPAMLATMLATDLSTATHLMIWLPTIGLLTVGLLQPVKGAIIALQWALRMHGFDGHPDPDRFDRVFAAAVTPRQDQSLR